MFLLFTLGQPHRTQSFATYLLSRSNCWTDLSTEEIIMNYRVVHHEESDDPHMHVKVIGDNPLPAGTIYPTKVTLQVVTDNAATNRDYQFVMQVNGTGAAFVGGSCDGDRRIAGRAQELVELTLQEPVPIQVWAGWAAGHEQVRLTPELILLPPAAADVQQAEAKEDKHLKENEENTWHEQLLHSCSNIDWTSLTTFAGRTIQHADSAELYTEGTVETPRIALRNANDFEMLVIHCTEGAQVGSSPSSCPHMAMVSASDEWPVLQLQEERTIYISGIYSLMGNPTTLYRTNALELEWTSPEEVITIGTAEEEKDEDFKKAASARHVEEEPRVHDPLRLAEEISERVVQGHVKQIIERDREAVKQRGDSWKASTGSTKDTGKKPQATPDQPFDHVLVEGTTTTDTGVVFHVGPHYYVGMAILIGVTLLTTQFCLCSSRKHKGRRDL